MRPSPNTAAPRLTLRVSEAVLDKIVVASAQSVAGVVDVHGTLVGALVGGVVGGAIGFAQGGPAGSAVGIPVGSALGGTAGGAVKALHDRNTFYRVGDRADLCLRLSTRSDVSLVKLARAVRKHVGEDVARLTGVGVGQIDVDFVEWHDGRGRPEIDSAS